MKLNLLSPLTLLSAVALMNLLGLVSSSIPATAQTEFPIDYIAFTGYGDNIQTARFVVPDTDTTVSAYGGQLRRYDVHVAKMFELTDYECSRPERNWSRIAWRYEAGGGEINMGTFFIGCSLARDVATAYGLGNTESTPVTYYRARATVDVPILNITGGKVATWMNFVSNFRPEVGNAFD